MGEYNKELEREYRRFCSIERDYLAVKDALETLEGTMDLTPFREEFNQLQENYIEARLKFNLYKESLPESVRRSNPATNQVQRDKEEAETQQALDTAA